MQLPDYIYSLPVLGGLLAWAGRVVFGHNSRIKRLETLAETQEKHNTQAAQKLDKLTEDTTEIRTTVARLEGTLNNTNT